MTRHGVNSRLYMGATTASPVAETHGINVAVETDFAEDSSQGDTWKTYLPGLSDMSLEFDKWFDQTASTGGTLLQAVINRTSQKWYFYPDASDSTIYMFGASGFVGGGGFDAPIDNIVDQHYMFRASSQPTYIHP